MFVKSYENCVLKICYPSYIMPLFIVVKGEKKYLHPQGIRDLYRK